MLSFGFASVSFDSADLSDTSCITPFRFSQAPWLGPNMRLAQGNLGVRTMFGSAIGRLCEGLAKLAAVLRAARRAAAVGSKVVWSHGRLL